MRKQVTKTSLKAHAENILSGVYTSHEKVILMALLKIQDGNKSEIFDTIKKLKLGRNAPVPEDETAVCRRLADMGKKKLVVKTKVTRPGLSRGREKRRDQSVWALSGRFRKYFEKQ